MANSTRDWPSIRIMTTDVSPASAPREMIPAKIGSPTLENASASGASADSSVYRCMPTTTSETAT